MWNAGLFACPWWLCGIACRQGTESLEQACVMLVDLANQRGGIDNITVALARAT